MPHTEPETSATVLRNALRSGQWYASLVEELAMLVGGIDELALLDAEPLPDERFDWAAVADPDRTFVSAVLAATDGFCDDLLDVEYRTIVRRLLALIASHDPRVLRRRTAAVRCAAALVWLALHANGAVGRRAVWHAEDIWARFGVSSCSSLGRTLLTATGQVNDCDAVIASLGPRGAVSLGDARLLHSTCRARLLMRRSDTEAMVERAVRKQAESRSMVDLGSGRVELRTRPVEFRWAVKGMSTTGRAHVVMAFGESEDDPDLVALTVPEAHRLQRSLAQALDASLMSRRR